MIGIEFEQSKTNHFLKKIFNTIDLSKYSFSFLEDEIYDNTNPDFTSFGIENFSKDPFEFINSDYYIIFLAIHVYLKEGKKKIIDNYEDFLNSDCQLIVLITDVACFEMYFKENELRDLVLSNLDAMNIKYNYKTLENDQRYTMHIN